MVRIGEEKGYIRLINARGETIGMTKNWQILPDAHNYIIFKNGNVVKAKNGRTGEIEFKDKNTNVVVNDIINSVADDESGITIKFTRGVFEGDDAIHIPKHGVYLIGSNKWYGTVLKVPIVIDSSSTDKVFHFDIRNITIDLSDTSFTTALDLGDSAGDFSLKYIKIRNCKTGIHGSNFGFSVWEDVQVTENVETGLDITGYNYLNTLINVRIHYIGAGDAGTLALHHSNVIGLAVEHLDGNGLHLYGGSNVISEFYAESVPNDSALYVGDDTTGSWGNTIIAPQLMKDINMVIGSKTKYTVVINPTFPGTITIDGDYNMVITTRQASDNIVDNGTGNLIIYADSSRASLYDVIGEVKFASNLVIPTSAPTNPEAGSMYFDPSTGELYVYDGSTWKKVTLT